MLTLPFFVAQAGLSAFEFLLPLNLDLARVLISFVASFAVVASVVIVARGVVRLSYADAKTEALSGSRDGTGSD